MKMLELRIFLVKKFVFYIHAVCFHVMGSKKHMKGKQQNY